MDVANYLKIIIAIIKYRTAQHEKIERKAFDNREGKEYIVNDIEAQCTFIYNDNPTRGMFVSQRSNLAIGTVPIVSTKSDMSPFLGKYLLFPTILLSESRLGSTCGQRYSLRLLYIVMLYVAFS